MHVARRWNTLDPNPYTWQPEPSARWTDYLGQQPYGDYDAELDGNDNPVTTERLRYLAGFGVHVQQTLDGQNDPVRYLHGDLIRSTMLTTDETGSVGVPPATLSYTAFGEVIGPTGGVGERLPAGFPRYGYGGGWGYESGPWGRNRDGSPAQSGPLTLYGVNPDLSPVTLQHVGWRWYQPEIGRFIQHDPMGVFAGPNVYLYCEANPLACADPLGFWSWGGFWGGLVGGAAGGAVGGAVGGGLAGGVGAVPGAIGGAVAGGILGGIAGGLWGGSPRGGAAIGTGVGLVSGFCLPFLMPHLPVIGPVVAPTAPGLVRIGNDLFRDGRFIGEIVTCIEHAGQVMYVVLTPAGQRIIVWGQR